MIYEIFLVAATTALPVVPQDITTTSDYLSSVANYIFEMQSTINTLAEIVEVVTIIIGFLGGILTVFSVVTQRNTLSEIRDIDKKIQTQVNKNKADHDSMIRNNHNEIKDDYERAKLQMEAILNLHKAEVNIVLERQNADYRNMIATGVKEEYDHIETLFSSHLIDRIRAIEATYSSSLQEIEDILNTFQNECETVESDGRKHFDFTRYNTLRHLLMRLVSGNRHDLGNSLGRLTSEYASKVGESTGFRLRELIVKIGKSGRLNRPDLRILADSLITEINRRFPPSEDVELLNSD